MRDYKFRAWDKKSKKMRSVESIGFGAISIYEKGYPVCNMLGYDIINQKAILIHRDSPHFYLMQFTNKYDKFNKEIYEDDIVKCKVDTDDNGNDIYINYKVIWHEIYSCYMFSSIQQYNSDGEYIEDEFLYAYNPNQIEIIGNIYENADLLEI